MKANNFSLLILGCLLLLSCRNNTVYMAFRHTDPDGWDKDSVLRFTIPVPDTAVTYDILLHLTHTQQYPFQNMWLFVNDYDTTLHQLPQRDTLGFYLADEHGIWLGRKGNGQVSLHVPYARHYRFSADTCTFTIRHGMRQDKLQGVTAIGLEVVRNNRQEKDDNGKE